MTGASRPDSSWRREKAPDVRARGPAELVEDWEKEDLETLEEDNR